MTDSSMGHQQLFAELKRRRVFRVMAVYGIVGFVILQIVDLAVPALLLPEWTYRFVALILLIGFPVAIVLAWAFEMTPQGVQKTQPAAPGEIEAIVAAPASQRIPAGLMALAGLVALVLGAWWVGTRTPTGKATGPTTEIRLATSGPDADNRPSIAVLPFADMSPDGDQEYFGDGMTDEILNVLVKAGQFRVSGRTSTFAYKQQEKSVRQIGAELGVSYLVEGSVRKAGDQLRITAQLIDTATDEHLWSDTYNAELTAANLFDIQSRIAVSIADALKVPLGIDAPSDLVTPTGDLEAYDLYLAGRSAMRKRSQSLYDAFDLFEAAIALDSTFAPAWASLAQAKEIAVWWTSWNRDDAHAHVAELLAGAERSATRALELDSDNPSALVALGSVYRDRGRWSEAEDLYERAMRIDPDNAEAYQQYGELLRFRGRIAESVQYTDRAAVLDPAPVRLLQVAFALELDDRASEAVEVYRLAMALDPDTTLAATWWLAAPLLAWLGEVDEAVAAMQTGWSAIRGPASLPSPEALRAWARGLAEGHFDELPAQPTLNALDLMWVGLPDSAVVELLEDNWFDDTGLLSNDPVWNPVFDSVRSDPRIQAHMEEIGLSDARLLRTPVEERTRPKILERAD